MNSSSIDSSKRLELHVGSDPLRRRDEPPVGARNLDMALRHGAFSQTTRLDIVARDLKFGPRELEIIQRLIEAMPVLREVVVSSGTPGDSTSVSTVIELYRKWTGRGLECLVQFVLDSEADAAILDRNPTSLTTVLAMSRTAVKEGIRVRWSIPVQPELIYRLESLFSLAKDERIDAVLVLPSMLPGRNDDSKLHLSSDDMLFLWDFVTYRLLDEESAQTPPDRLEFYRALRDHLSGKPLQSAAEPVALLFRPEASTTDWMLSYDLTRAPHAVPGGLESTGTGQSGQDRTTVNRVTDLVEVALEGSRALCQWMFSGAPLKGPVKAPEQIPRVLVIGAYGGEHIGDAAILGGVLFRMHWRYGTKKAILVSQRARHTRHLIPMLDTPVEVTVEDYEQSGIRHLLEQVDAVVFAGGPLMDLPKQLVKHLYTVSMAHRKGKPFLIEGIGAGPFIRQTSLWTGRRLVMMADRITVRTKADHDAPLVQDLHPEVGRDPAFDYLDTRPSELTRVPDVDREWIDKLLRDTKGRTKVGLNVRPIRHDYTEGTSVDNRVDYTRFIEDRFEQRLANGLKAFHDASAKPPCFVFFPMNSIQFGLSDLRSAYRIKRYLPGYVDFRIWEGDASVDGVIALLRQLDVVISMRFHATIYALSQQRRVIGIDYRIGKRDKVAALLSDFGQSENCLRIDEVTPKWLYERLGALTAGLPDSA